MEPTAEQLIRDYLNRLSVAARTRLRSDDRRAFVARTREFIERRVGAPATADAGEVQEVLSSLGEPVAAVEDEYARLAAARSKRAAARSGLWRPRGSVAGEPPGVPPDADTGPDSDAVADPRPAPSRRTPSRRHEPRVAVDVSHLDEEELKGDIEKKVKVNRPLTSRWRPGQPLKQERPTRPVRIPRPRTGGSRSPDVNGVAPTGSGRGGEPADSGTHGSQAPAREPGAAPASPAETPPGGAPSATTVLPADWLSGAAQPGPASAATATPEAATRQTVDPGTPSPGAGAPEAARSGDAPPKVGTAEVSPPGAAAPEAASSAGVPPRSGAPEVSSRGAAPGAASPEADAPAARPAGGAPAPASRATRPLTARLPRLQRATPSGARQGRARRMMTFWGQRRLEAAAVILMALAGLVYPFPIWLLGFSLWLLGVMLAAASRQWSPNEKWAGILGPVALVIAGTSVGLALGGQRHTLAAYGHEVLADSRYMIQISGLLGASYLAWRAYRGRRYPVPPWRRSKRS